jgi:hypothetical protein
MVQQATISELPSIEECRRRERDEFQKSIAASRKTIAESCALMAEADRMLARR